MATIKFKAKAETCYCASTGKALYRYVQFPVLRRSHCDMGAFRTHPRFGSYANSDMFAGMLSRIRSDILAATRGIHSGVLRLDVALPDNVKIDESGFLVVVTIEV